MTTSAIITMIVSALWTIASMSAAFDSDNAKRCVACVVLAGLSAVAFWFGLSYLIVP